MWMCPSCGANVEDADRRCWGCGWQAVAEGAAAGAGPAPDGGDRAAPGWWTCARCGTDVEPGFEVCWNCGTSVEGVEDPEFVPDGPPEEPAGPVPPAADAPERVVREERAFAPAVTLACPRCGGAMREGFVAPMDRDPAPRSVVPLRWQQGVPAWSLVWGWTPVEGSLPVQAFRCERCAYLEFYARQR